MPKALEQKIAGRLLRWYAANGREFPFRETKDPYRILVCEILLRKTTAKQVASIYHRFFKRYPRIKSLADASPEEVAKILRPLGIRSRAFQLVDAAGVITSQFRGRVPSDLETLMELEGVGRYVASCVLTFGYRARMPMVDSNADRVLSRLVLAEAKKGFDPWKLYDLLAPEGAERQFHYGMLDLAHYVCRPRNPRCSMCPINKFCRYASRFCR